MTNLNKKLRIMQIAPFAFPIGDTARYGGIEQVIRDLDTSLSELGHESLVVATGDSKINGRLLPTFEKSLWRPQSNKEDGWKYEKGEFNYLQELEHHSRIALEYIKQCQPDIIHDHVGFIKSRIFQKTSNLPPIIYTLHDPIDPKSKKRLREIQEKKGKGVSFNAISYSQKRFFEDHIKIDYMVYNSVDVRAYNFSSKGKGFVLHLGLLNKPKGTDIALDVAKELGKKIIIAGPVLVGRIHQKNPLGAVGEFWDEILKPKIDHIHRHPIPPKDVDNFIDWFSKSKNQSVYIGELNFHQKREWFSKSDAFYFPIRREEPFGLVMIESMSGGAPVVAYNKGAVPEIIKHEETGFVVECDYTGPKNDVTGHELELTKKGFNNFCNAASKVHRISRENCRTYVEQNFAVGRQVKDYLNSYSDMIQKN